MTETRRRRKAEQRLHAALLVQHRAAVRRLEEWAEKIVRLSKSLDSRDQVWKFFEDTRLEARDLGVEEELRLACWQAVGQAANPAMVRVTQKYFKGERPAYED